jgi:hypothetical protein
MVSIQAEDCSPPQSPKYGQFVLVMGGPQISACQLVSLDQGNISKFFQSFHTILEILVVGGGPRAILKGQWERFFRKGLKLS